MWPKGGRPVPSDELTREDIDLLRELRSWGGLPDFFWQLPLIRFFLIVVAALALGIAADIFLDQDWLSEPLLVLAPLWLGHYMGESKVKRCYQPLLLKLLDRDPELRQRL